MISTGPELASGDFLLPEIDTKDSGLPDPDIAPTSGKSFDLLAYLQRTEEDLIRRALNASGGAQAEAARRMGISRSLLAYKLQKYGIRPPER
jgi:two-component system NtrC family response regulator